MDPERAKRLVEQPVDDLLEALAGPQPGSEAHELLKAAIQVRIAEEQRDAARDALRWARLTSIATAAATLIALAALLIALK